MWIAAETANFAAYQLPKDKWLLARLYEGFLLPHVSLANAAMWQDPARGRLLEAAVGAFGNAGEADKQRAVLEWLVAIAQKPASTNPNALTLDLNTRDWARSTLAALLFQGRDATTQDLERALALLQAVESPAMKNLGQLQERVQTQLAKLQSRPQPLDAASRPDGATP